MVMSAVVGREILAEKLKWVNMDKKEYRRGTHVFAYFLLPMLL